MGTTPDPEFAIPLKEAEEQATQAISAGAELATADEPPARSQCVLNVTDQEYARILQLNHDAVVWTHQDKQLVHGLELLLGKEVADQVGKFAECRMEKQHDLAGLPRVQAV